MADHASAERGKRTFADAPPPQWQQQSACPQDGARRPSLSALSAPSARASIASVSMPPGATSPLCTAVLSVPAAHTPQTPHEEGDVDSPTSSTAPTVIVPEGSSHCPSAAPSYGISPGSLSHHGESPTRIATQDPTPRDRSEQATVTKTHTPSEKPGEAVASPESIVVYTLVPEADIARTHMLTSASPRHTSATVVVEGPTPLRLPTQPPTSLVDVTSECFAAPDVLQGPDAEAKRFNTPQQHEHGEADEKETIESPMIFREGSLQERLDTRRLSPSATRAHHTHIWTPRAAPLVASIPLDADKATYEALCTTGVAALSQSPAKRRKTRQGKRARSVSPNDEQPMAAADTKVAEETANADGEECPTAITATEPLRSAWWSREQVEEAVQHTSMSPSDVDARLDILEEVELAQLALLLPRTFPLYRLVSQIVPTTVWLPETDRARSPSAQPLSRLEHEVAETATAETSGGRATSSPQAPLTHAPSFVDALRRTHRAHVLGCIIGDDAHLTSYTQGCACAVKGEADATTVTTQPHTSGTHTNERRCAVKRDSEDEGEGGRDHARWMGPEPSSDKSTSSAPFLARLATAEGEVTRAARARLSAARRLRHHVTTGGRGALVEWQDGTVGYTPDLDGLFEEERIRLERTLHPLPSAHEDDRVRVQTRACGRGDAFPSQPMTSVPLSATPLRHAALTQLHRLRLFNAARSAFVHARAAATAVSVDRQSHDETHQDAGDTTACHAKSTDLPCACARCLDWLPHFAQVQPVPAGLDVYLEHLHGASAVPESIAFAAARTGGCVPLRRHAYDQLASVPDRRAPSAQTSAQPMPQGLRRDLRLTSSYMAAHAIQPIDVFASLPTVTEAYVRGPTSHAEKKAQSTTTEARRGHVEAVPRPKTASRTASAARWTWLDDAVLDEVVLVAVAPRGQPYALELVPPSIAFRRLLLAKVMAHARLYTETVLPRVKRTATESPAASPDVWGARLRAVYTTALAAALDTALSAATAANGDQARGGGLTHEEAGHGNDDVQWLRVHVLPSLLATAEPTTATPAIASLQDIENELPWRALQTDVDLVAAQHARSLISSAADDVVRVVLDALRTVLYRRTFTMYELMRLLSSKALFLAHRPLIVRYKEWYAQTPSPAAVLRLLQGSSRFGPSLVRLFPNLVQRTRTPTNSAEADDALNGTVAGKKGVKQESDEEAASRSDEEMEDEDDDDDQSTWTTRRRSGGSRPVSRLASAASTVYLDFVPEAALLEPSYLVRFTLWVLETHHAQVPHTHEMVSILLEELASVQRRATQGSGMKTASDLSENAATRPFRSVFPMTTAQGTHGSAANAHSISTNDDDDNADRSGMDATDEQASSWSSASQRYASASYPFVVPHCPSSVDAALSHILMAVGVRGRTFLSEEIDKYVNTLVLRGER